MFDVVAGATAAAGLAASIGAGEATGWDGAGGEAVQPPRGVSGAASSCGTALGLGSFTGAAAGAGGGKLDQLESGGRLAFDPRGSARIGAAAGSGEGGTGATSPDGNEGSAGFSPPSAAESVSGAVPSTVMLVPQRLQAIDTMRPRTLRSYSSSPSASRVWHAEH